MKITIDVTEDKEYESKECPECNGTMRIFRYPNIICCKCLSCNNSYEGKEIDNIIVGNKIKEKQSNSDKLKHLTKSASKYSVIR